MPLSYGLPELAFDMLVECERQPGEQKFDCGHFEDLIGRILKRVTLIWHERSRITAGHQLYQV
jgi:hypothetical protein